MKKVIIICICILAVVLIAVGAILLKRHYDLNNQVMDGPGMVNHPNEFHAQIEYTSEFIQTDLPPDDNDSQAKPTPENISVTLDDIFHGFTVTDISKDRVVIKLNGNTRYSAYLYDASGKSQNLGDIVKFTLHSGEWISLNDMDILDASHTITIKLIEITVE